MLTIHFWPIVGAISKEVSVSEQINDAKQWIKILLYFIIPQIMVVWHCNQVKGCSKDDKSHMSFGNSS